MRPRKKNQYAQALERRRQRAAQQGGGEEVLEAPPAPSKPLSEMTEAELDAALVDAKRALLRATRAETEATRGVVAASGGEGSGGSALTALIRDKKRKRPSWR